MPSVTVYGKPDCVQCEYTERKLREAGVPFDKIDVTVSGLGYQAVQNSGKTTLPMVVVTGDQTDTWHGFRPDKIKSLVA